MGMLLCNSCSQKQEKEADVKNVRLFVVEKNKTTSMQEFPGRVKAAEEVNLAFKVSGTLQRVYVEEGSKIRKGELIAEMDPRDYQTLLDATEAEYLRIKSEAERVIALYADSVGTADAYDKAVYGLQQITAKYRNARNQLADTKIYAPFDGYIQKRLFDPPTVLAAGMPVISLISGRLQEVEINIPASTYISRDKMEAFHASFDFIPDRKVSLRLISIAPKANANQLYTVRLAVPENLSPQPSPGMNTMVNIVSKDSGEEITEIPSSALFNKNGKSYVWIYDKQSETIKERCVSVSRLHTNGRAVVNNGLSNGETVVTTGVHNLKNNQKVKPMDVESETNVGGLL